VVLAGNTNIDRTQAVDVSVIVAVYNEDPRNLVALLDRLESVIAPSGSTYEVLFVNDGSRPPTSNALRQIAAEHDHVKLFELSRNFGQQAAITCGLDNSSGQVVVNIDSDLQDPPELILDMIKKWKEGYDVVYAQRSTRRDRWAKRFTAYWFYRLLGALSTVEIPWDTGDFRLMDRKVVNALQQLPEKTRFLRGMIPWLGFKQCGIAIDRGAREVGESTYTLRKLITLALDGLLALSIAPLYFISVVGGVLLALSLLALVLVVGLGAYLSEALRGQLFIVSCLGVFSGIQVFCTGVVAAYLAKVLDETRARPTYIVANAFGLAQSERADSKPQAAVKSSLAQFAESERNL